MDIEGKKMHHKIIDLQSLAQIVRMRPPRSAGIARGTGNPAASRPADNAYFGQVAPPLHLNFDPDRPRLESD